MTRHYVLFDTNITNAGIFDENNLGTDLREASKEAEYYANHLAFFALTLKKITIKIQVLNIFSKNL